MWKMVEQEGGGGLKRGAVKNRHKAAKKSRRRLWDFKQSQLSGLQSSQDAFVIRNLGIATNLFIFQTFSVAPPASSLHKMKFLLESLVPNGVPTTTSPSHPYCHQLCFSTPGFCLCVSERRSSRLRHSGGDGNNLNKRRKKLFPEIFFQALKMFSDLQRNCRWKQICRISWIAPNT